MRICWKKQKVWLWGILYFRNCMQSWILFHLVHICKKLTQHCKAWWMHAYLQYLIPTWAMWQMALANFVRSTPHCVTLASSWQSPELIFVATIKTVQVVWNIQACLICLQDMWNWFFAAMWSQKIQDLVLQNTYFFGHFFVSIIFQPWVIALHYRLRGSVGFWKIKKGDKSRHLFLIQ